MTKHLSTIPLVACLFLIAGCASLPDFDRIQGNMDRMVYYMGVMSSNMPLMVHSTQRMADNADRMKYQVDGFISHLQGAKKNGERVVQNYAQALLDNDRAVIRNLKGIRQELGDIKETMRSRGPVREEDQAAINRNLHARLQELDAQLKAISSRIQAAEKNARGPS